MSNEPFDGEPTAIGALVLFTAQLDAVTAFYGSLGLRLESERHGGGPVHVAARVGATHFAIFESPAPSAAAPDRRTALPHRSPGAQFFGFTVPCLERAFARAVAAGAPVIQAPATYPFGRRALVEDPDGRAVELFERPAGDGESR